MDIKTPKTRKEREVWQAIQSLQADGLRLDDMTGEILGERLLALGCNRGSSTDIYRYKRTWIAAFQPSTGVQEMPLSSLLSDPITQAATALKEKITQESQLEIKRIQEQAQTQYDELLQVYEIEQKKSLELQQEYEASCLQARHWEEEALHNQSLLQEKTLQLEEKKEQIGRLDVLFQQLQTNHEKQYVELKQSLQNSMENNQVVVKKVEQFYLLQVEDLKRQLSSQQEHFLLEIEQSNEVLKKSDAQLKQARTDLLIKEQHIMHLQEKITRLEISLQQQDIKKGKILEEQHVLKEKNASLTGENFQLKIMITEQQQAYHEKQERILQVVTNINHGLSKQKLSKTLTKVTTDESIS